MNTVIVRLYERVGDIQYYALHVFEHKAIARFSELETFNNKLSREYTSFPKKSLFSHTKKDNTKLEARRYLLQEWLRDVTNSRNDFEELEKFIIQQKVVYGEVGEDKCMKPSSEHLWNGNTPASLCKSNYNSSTKKHEIHVFDKETQQWPKTEHMRKDEQQDNAHEFLGLRFRDCRDAKISLHYAPWNRDFSIPVIGLMQRHYDTIVATYHEQIVFLYCSAIGKAAYFDVSTFQWHVLHFKLDSTKASYRVAVVAVDKTYHIITPSQHYSINIETMKLHKLTNVSGFPDYTTMSAIRAREYLVVTGGNHQFLYNIVTDSWQKLPTMGCQNTYTMRLYYDNANTVYAVARRSEKGVQVMELYYLELDNKKWMFLGANHDAVFMVSNDSEASDGKDFIDERVELDIMRCLEDTILNKTENIYAGLYTLAKISKEMQDMMELVDTISTFDRVDLFKREPKMLEAMEACWECDHRLTDKLGLIIVQLVKVDPTLEAVIPEKMRAYQKLTTDTTTGGRTYLCPTYSKKKYKNSFTYTITSSSTSSSDYSSPSGCLPSIRKSVVLPNPNVLPDDEANRRDDVLQQIRDNNIKVPGFFCCPITTSIIFDPVVAFDGISYEKHVIKEWFAKGKRTSPVTNLVIKTDVIPNTNLKQSIAQFLLDNDIKLS